MTTSDGKGQYGPGSMRALGASSFVLRFAELATDYLIFVHAGRPGEKAGLILLLDADDQFETARDIIDRLRRAGRLPNLHLVGIGYGGGYRSPLNRRIRDYTPSRDPEEAVENGGAGLFLEFISKRLIPALSERLLIDQNNIGVAGHSLGSLFGLYALAQPNSSFSRYLVSSPSIWWHHRSVLEMLKASAQRGIPSRSAYFSVGDLDTDSMRSDLALLENQLRAEPIAKLEYRFQTIRGTDHYNAFPDAMANGLEWLYSR
jgi:predicted alpha/beta superfamily hydrolase